MAAYTSTPTSSGEGSLVSIAKNIGTKIRDAAEQAKEEKEKAVEAGESPKKGSLFKSALKNQFNPIKSKKAKGNWNKQFSWNNKKSDKPEAVNGIPTGESGGAGKTDKLKNFIAGGFSAIIADTTNMVGKLTAINQATTDNLGATSRSSATLVAIKETLDAQTDLRRKQYEENQRAAVERDLEKTQQVGKIFGGAKKTTKGGGEGQEAEGSGEGGSGWFDNILGGIELVDSILDIRKSLQGAKLGKTAGNILQGVKGLGSGASLGGASIAGGVGLAMSAGGEGMFQLGKWGDQTLTDRAKLIEEKKARGENTFLDETLQVGQTGLGEVGKSLGVAMDVGGAPFRYAIEALRNPFLSPEQKEEQANNLAKFDARIREHSRSWMNQIDFMNIIPDQKGGFGNIYGNDTAQQDMMGRMSYSEGGVLPMNAGGFVDNPTKTTLNPGDAVLPLNSTMGKNLFGEQPNGPGLEDAQAIPFKSVGATLLGVASRMLKATDSGIAGDLVRQDITSLSRTFGIANLSTTTSLGRAQFTKQNTEKKSEDFLMKVFKGMKFSIFGGEKNNKNNNKKNPPGIGPSMTATGGSLASQYITSPFGQRTAPTTGASTNHRGVDVAGGPWKQGAPVSVIKPGEVVAAEDLGRSGWGKYVVVKHHDGTHSLYGHLDSINVKKGDKIENKSGAAIVIGTVGNTGVSTGPHLHFELGTGWDGGQIQNHINPKDYIDQYVRGGGTVTVQSNPEISQNAPAPLEEAQVVRMAQDGMVGPSWLPWNWGKVVDKHRNTKSTDYANSNSILAQAAKRREMMKELGYSRGGTGGDSQKSMREKMRQGEKARRATQQRLDLGLVKGGGTSGYTVARTGMRPGESPDQWAQRQSEAIRLADKLNREQGLGKYRKPAPRPAPARPAAAPRAAARPASRPGSSTGATSTSAVVNNIVSLPQQNSTSSSGYTSGSFGSTVAEGKTRQLLFADYLYEDLV
jgi:murein DD-endopeptidase MepM/ murein hydrolase activator NlpD